MFSDFSLWPCAMWNELRFDYMHSDGQVLAHKHAHNTTFRNHQQNSAAVSVDTHSAADELKYRCFVAVVVRIPLF